MAKKREGTKIRKPVARKATRPIDTRKGKRGYSRRRDKRNLRRNEPEHKDDE